MEQEPAENMYTEKVVEEVAEHPQSGAGVFDEAVEDTAAVTVTVKETEGATSAAMGAAKATEGAATEEATSAAGGLVLVQACVHRLARLQRLVATDRIAREGIMVSLAEAGRLLERVFQQRTGGVRPEDDEDLFKQPAGGDAPSLAVPEKVQEWLSFTFTRKASKAVFRRRRLRSLATVIQTGVYIDRLFRRRRSLAAPVSLPAEVRACLDKGAQYWSFDPFRLAELSHNRPIRAIGLHLFQRLDLIEKFSIAVPALEAFLDMVEDGYKLHRNPYHNCTHSADVAQTCCYIVQRHGMTGWLSDLELLSLLFAALVHDFEHTGTTNSFHVQTGSQLAVAYNDKAVLENHHVSAVFKRMLESDSRCNIVQNLNHLEYRQFRSLVIDMVLATDMSTHFAQVSAMKEASMCPENLPRVDILSYILHSADISHPAKEWLLHERWTHLLKEEFFAQGDRERQLGMQCSPLCDREKTLIAASQVGFIEYIVEPCYRVLTQLLSGVQELLSSPSGKKSEEQQNDNEAETTESPDAQENPGAAEEPPWVPLELLAANKERWRSRAEANARQIACIEEMEEDVGRPGEEQDE